MGNAVRWTKEDLDAYQARGKAREHRMEGSQPERKREMPKESKLEQRFVQQLAEAGITGYVRNFFPVLGRDWELDFAWPDKRCAVEIDGMAHRTKGRFKGDMEKHATLMLAGWRVLRVCGDDVRHGRAIEWTKQLLA